MRYYTVADSLILLQYVCGLYIIVYHRSSGLLSEILRAVSLSLSTM